MTEVRRPVDLDVRVPDDFFNRSLRNYCGGQIFVENVVMTWPVQQVDHGAAWVRREAI